ncbi:D(2) dopamine receptor Dopamine D2 receptor [Channa argus]|uniref:D(2) dopamine receptor Dopamine D2 receptor n=1 Tax=Channa argus TaxID=215402 RepID=A0A6G1PEU9_CHAAH|nr:D(2) dopamine receptor Dopamine D2 receptor [Channa argus]
MRRATTPAWGSENSTIWEEYNDIAFVVANSLILLITSAVGIAANIFVLLAVYHQKSLQTLNNALVVDLAIIDTLRCVIDCPILLTIIIFAYQRGHVDTYICDIQVASFSFSCCIQLLTLACISAERYQAIAQPFKTSQRRKRIIVLIPLTWTLSILAAAFCFISLKDSPVNVRCKGSQRETLSSYDTFGLFMLLPLWAACFSIIIGFYARIFTLVRSHNRKVFDKGTLHLSKKEKTENQQNKEENTAWKSEHGKSVQTQTLSKSVQLEQHFDVPNLSKKGLSNTVRPATKAPQCVSIPLEKKTENTLEMTDLGREQPHLLAVQTEDKTFKTESSTPWVSNLGAKPSNEGDVASVRSSASMPQKVSTNLDTENQSKDVVKTEKVPSEMRESGHHVPSNVQLDNPESISVLLIAPKRSDGGETPAVASVDQVPSLPPVSSNNPETGATHQNMVTEGAVCMMPSKANRERAKKMKESKMAKRAGYIIITFLLFWLPLITTILVNFAVYNINNTQIKIIQDMEILSVSIACVTSLSDPIIYAAVNPQFRTEYYRLKNRLKFRFNKK